MKKLTWILSILLIIIVCLYTILFTGFGNDLVKPYAEKIIKSKSGIDVKFTEFKIGFSSADIKALVNSDLNLSVFGNYNLFKRNFNFNYAVEVSSLKSLGLNLKQKMTLSGIAKGALNNFIVDGSGLMVGSHLEFATRIKEFKPFELKLNANNINIEELLAILNNKPYIKGKINLTADINEKDVKRAGIAKIVIQKAYTNNEIIKRDFNISLPKNFNISVNSDIKIENEVATANTVINSPIATAKAIKSVYNIEQNILNSDFSLNIPNLANLEPIIKQKLSGKIDLNGNLELKANKISFLDAAANGLGGSILAKLKDNKINVNINSIKLDEILKLVSMPPFINGSINGNAVINNINNYLLTNGSANLKIQKASLRHTELKKFANISLLKDINFNSDINININNGIAVINSNLISDLLKLNKFDATYELSTNNANATLQANIDDLSKFDDIVGQKLNGNIDINANANIKANKISNLNLSAKAFGGEVLAKLVNQNLNLNLNNIHIQDLFSLIAQKPLINGILNAKLNLDSINLENLNGKGDIAINNAMINAKNASELLEKNVPDGIKFSFEAKPTFTNSIIYFSSNLTSDLLNLSKFDGSFDMNKQTLDSTYNLQIPNLSNFQFLTQKKLVGNISANGKIKFLNSLEATLVSKLFGSTLNVDFKNDILNANMQKFQINKLLKMLDYSEFYEGVGDMKANYNIKNQKGNFLVDLLEGKLAKSGFTDAVSLAFHQDIANEVFKNGIFKGNINKNLIDFDANMNSPKIDIKVANGKIDTLSSKLSIPIAMNIEKTDIQIDIGGTTEAPQYKISSKYIKKKIEKEIGRGLKRLLKK